MDTLMGRYRNVSILAAAIFLQIVGLAVQVKRRSENQSTRLIRVWTVAAVTPFEKNIVRVQTGVSGLWNNYLYLRGVRQQNRELQDQIQQLKLEQVRLRQDAEQARRLQSLLGFKEQFIDKTTAAQVIGSSGSEQSRIVYLDKGTADGVTPDMAVISEQGIVGKVIQVFRHTSQVLLINDQTSGVGTIVERSRLQGVLKGRATGELVLDKIMVEEDVQAGDRVLTSGGDQIFPKGLPVGTVAHVTRGGEFLQITVEPAASLNHLEEVLVITKKQEREPAVANSAPVRAADILAERLPSVPDQVTPAAANGNPAAPPKPKPQATQAPEAGASARASLPAANVKPATAPGNPKIQAPSAPHTQPVDLVRPKTTPSEQNTTAVSGKQNANVSTTSTLGAGGQSKTPSTQLKNQETSASPQIKIPSANPSSTKPAGTNTVNTAATGAATTAKPKTPVSGNSAGKTSAITPAATPIKTAPATTQSTKPPKPATPALKPAPKPTQAPTQPALEGTPQ